MSSLLLGFILILYAHVRPQLDKKMICQKQFVVVNWTCHNQTWNEWYMIILFNDLRPKVKNYKNIYIGWTNMKQVNYFWPI